MKIITIIGARPQFIKAAAVSRAIAGYNKQVTVKVNEIIVHTGQHYDEKMSSVFFNQLDIPEPIINLGISAKTHGSMTGRMLENLENVLVDNKPDLVLVYGDTNSTLAGALAAVKLKIPVAHVEAGLRSFNRIMPEEINRIVADHLSDILLCPTATAVSNLVNEGITKGVHLVGDVMYDIALYYKKIVQEQFTLQRWKLIEKGYVLSTVHRAENTDDPVKLKNIFSALQEIANEIPVVLPLHPRTRKMLTEYGAESFLEKLNVIEPVSYFEMMRLEMSARAILTDSGGVQKEAYFLNVPCLTLRDETEWIETVKNGWNTVTGVEKNNILKAFESYKVFVGKTINAFGDGCAAEKILKTILQGV